MRSFPVVLTTFEQSFFWLATHLKSLMCHRKIVNTISHKSKKKNYFPFNSAQCASIIKIGLLLKLEGRGGGLHVLSGEFTERVYTVNIGYRVSFLNTYCWWCASRFFQWKKCAVAQKFLDNTGLDPKHYQKNFNQ